MGRRRKNPEAPTPQEVKTERAYQTVLEDCRAILESHRLAYREYPPYLQVKSSFYQEHFKRTQETQLDGVPLQEGSKQ